MVAGGNKDGAVHLPQTAGKGGGCLAVDMACVQQIAAEQNQIDLLPLCKGAEVGEQKPLLSPAAGSGLRAQAGEGAVQMEVGGVQDFQHKITPLNPRV